MTGKSEFNAEEWSMLMEGPPTAGMMVITAQRGGTIRESISMGRVYTEAREQHSGSELLGELVAGMPEFDRERFRSVDDVRTQGSQLLRDASALIDERGTPEEAEAYKRFVLTVAERAAEAHKEGGFLGVGGKRVSEEEDSVLGEIAETLGIERAGTGESEPGGG